MSMATARRQRAGMIAHTTVSAATLRLGCYVDKVADLTAVGLAAPPRRGFDLRIDAACLHLAEVHSMPLHRIVELVARAIARRARNGAPAGGRGKRVAHRCRKVA
jgi:hypothetical protein